MRTLTIKQTEYLKDALVYYRKNQYNTTTTYKMMLRIIEENQYTDIDANYINGVVKEHMQSTKKYKS